MNGICGLEMNTPKGSLVSLHLEIGSDFLTVILDKFGVQGWNRWVCAIIQRLPLTWEAGEEEPPAHIDIDVGEMDFSRRDISGIDLGLVACDGASFEGVSAVGALFGHCRNASFRLADIRDAIFTGNISGADFTNARLDDASFADAYFDDDNPPIGLPPDLVQGCCRLDHDDEPDDWGTSVTGLVTLPVHIRASIAESAPL